MADEVKKEDGKTSAPIVTDPPALKYGGEPADWPASKHRKYQSEVSTARMDAISQAHLDRDNGSAEIANVCTDSGRGIDRNKCKCVECRGARAAFDKQRELTGYVVEK